MEKLDVSWVERLLHEEEGVALDFKRAQYPFVGADDAKKGELLKDILAFANAWRRSDAYILIGVDEVKGARSRVVGVGEHLEDAALQQFVNSKTQRPVSFAYTSLRYGECDIAVIQIPMQERPFYLKQPFGKLKANTVYIRRGSSTAEATPDEISKMGSRRPELNVPTVEVFFADPTARQRIEDVVLKCVALDSPKCLPDYHERTVDDLSLLPSFRSVNRRYYRELTRFTKMTHLVSPLHLAIANHGGATALDVRIELSLDATADVVVLDEASYPSAPREAYSMLDTSVVTSTVFAQTVEEVTVQRVGSRYLVCARTEKVHPKSIFWFQDSFFIGSTKSQKVELAVTVFADNLHTPHTQRLAVDCIAVTRKVELDDVLELETQREMAQYRDLLDSTEDVDGGS